MIHRSERGIRTNSEQISKSAKILMSVKKTKNIKAFSQANTKRKFNLNSKKEKDKEKTKSKN